MHGLAGIPSMTANSMPNIITNNLYCQGTTPRLSENGRENPSGITQRWAMLA